VNVQDYVPRRCRAQRSTMSDGRMVLLLQKLRQVIDEEQ